MKMKKSVVIFPAPLISHLVSTIQLAKHIALRRTNLSVTILLMRHPFSPAASSSFVAAAAGDAAASGLDVRFVELPPIQLTHPEGMQGLTLLSVYADMHKPTVLDALLSLTSTTTVSSFIVDFVCTSVIDVAAELGIPAYVFFTSGAALAALMLHLPHLDRKIKWEFRDSKNNIEVPGMSPIPALKLPSPLLDGRDGEEYRWFLYHSRRLSDAKGIIINTFEELECKAMKALLQGKCAPGGLIPPVRAVGPLLGLDAGMDCSDHDCIRWLNQQSHSSVVFLCFGSMGALPVEQVREMARGLELSGHRFLWSVRTRLGQGHRFMPCDADLDEVLPAGFVERTQERGLVWAGWVPQLAILSHPAIGGFVSHCGWNSTLESVWFGVPLIGWPLDAEQRMNAFVLEKDMGLSLCVRKEDHVADGLVKGEELEMVVVSLMEGEEGKRVREKMKMMKEMGRAAMQGGGSSDSNLSALVEEWTSGSGGVTCR
ncbi:anthocyanidin 3-O-glucosyltransferase 2-like [Nymphaea colorata]|uniref:anthocyanidin 3-O-glucosyltransferase 2-like n=1 Tax=Nymphaea colorata TaxID=210225 RepID=UPI00129D5302|nr:anthocyanidin 3-O-glucosyltransferase 2-like [Nymphaea colorata]